MTRTNTRPQDMHRVFTQSKTKAIRDRQDTAIPDLMLTRPAAAPAEPGAASAPAGTRSVRIERCAKGSETRGGPARHRATPVAPRPEVGGPRTDKAAHDQPCHPALPELLHSHQTEAHVGPSQVLYSATPRAHSPRTPPGITILQFLILRTKVGEYQYERGREWRPRVRSRAAAPTSPAPYSGLSFEYSGSRPG